MGQMGGESLGERKQTAVETLSTKKLVTNLNGKGPGRCKKMAENPLAFKAGQRDTTRPFGSKHKAYVD